MKYYKHNNEVLGFESDGSQDSFIPQDAVLMTDAEVEEFVNPPKTPEQLAEEAKQAKLQALSEITVTTASGKVFDGRDIDQQRMVSAIMSADVVGMTETQWKLADNTVETVALVELKEALALSIQATGAIIVG